MAKTTIKTKEELAKTIRKLLDDYVRETGDPLVAVLFRPSAFSDIGQLRSPAPQMPPRVASSITYICKRRTEAALEYRIKQEEAGLGEGFITCA